MGVEGGELAGEERVTWSALTSGTYYGVVAARMEAKMG